MRKQRGDAPADAWVCPACNTQARTPYCPTCGEKALQPKDLTFMGLIGQVFHSLSSVDGRLLRSLWALIARPGVITDAYVRGPRKPYIGPFQLFLIVNVVFFAVQSLVGSPIFSNSLRSHVREQDWSVFARTPPALRDASRLRAAPAGIPVAVLVRSAAADFYASLIGRLRLGYVATGVVYEAAGVVRALKVALLAVVIAAAVPGYRFVVFLVTLYFT